MTDKVYIDTTTRTAMAQALITALGATGAKMKEYAGTMHDGVGAAIAATTLAATITSGATSLNLTSASGFPTSGNYLLFCEAEQMTVTAGQGTTTLTVIRGVNGTAAAAHTSGVAIVDAVLLATVTWASVPIGTATAGAIDVDEASASQTSGGFLSGTVGFTDLTTSGDVVKVRLPANGKGYTHTGTVVTGQNLTLTNLSLPMFGAFP